MLGFISEPIPRQVKEVYCSWEESVKYCTFLFYYYFIAGLLRCRTSPTRCDI